LRSDEPAYTISTYFTRPGNGCHLHHDPSQLRTISYREAARIQAFPDSFCFHGSFTSIANQIGNAVPPLLAYSLAREFGAPGILIDLFAGAGGLALGFKWAGWTSAVASDVDKHAMATFAQNVHAEVVVGDIREDAVREAIVEKATRALTCGGPRLLVGGPPCQGFSTAGKRRSREDERNHLFRDYCHIVERVDPDAFLFENVTGLLNMEKGEVFKDLLSELQSVAREVRVFQVSAQDYGVPQRRRRVIIVGFRRMEPFKLSEPPLGLGALGGTPVTVSDALDDLPALFAGEDGESKEYRTAPQSAYQRLMRGHIDAATFLQNLRNREAVKPRMKSANASPSDAWGARRRGRSVAPVE
jgi:DNA (cytosine-5)-methyltransferase 1